MEGVVSLKLGNPGVSGSSPSDLGSVYGCEGSRLWGRGGKPPLFLLLWSGGLGPPGRKTHPSPFHQGGR